MEDIHEKVAIYKFKDALGTTIKIERKIRNLTSEELAYKSNISTQYLANIMNGSANPTLAVLLKVSFGLETPLSELFVKSEILLEGGGKHGEHS